MLKFDGNFREKNALMSLIATAIIFGAYFVYTLFLASSSGRGFLILIALLIFFTILRLILFATLKLGHGDELADERDATVAGKAYRNAYYVLAVMVILVAVFITFTIYQSYSGTNPDYANGARSGFPILKIIINSMVFTVVVGELTQLGSKVFFYKKGA